MNILSIFCVFILQRLGECSDFNEEHRTKRQTEGNTGQQQQVPSYCQGNNRSRPECHRTKRQANVNLSFQQPQVFNISTPPSFVIGNTGQFQQVPSYCRGNRRWRPECQQFNQGSGSQNTNKGRPKNCKGNRRFRPECQQQQGGGGGGGGGGSGSGSLGGGAGGGKRPPNCTGRRRRRPECQGVNFPSLNCQGRRKNRPECKNQSGSGGSGGSGGKSDQAISSAITQVPWLQNLISHNEYVKIPGLPKTPTKSQQSRFYQLAFGARDEPFHACITPRFERGHCRFLQHCVLNEFANNFNLFLRYVCFIQGVYVGACCPDSRYPSQTTTRRPLITSTTRRPTKPPNSRKCGVSNRQQTRIVGGKPAAINAYPWAAALLRNDNQYCGGVLINTRHVMTAAHCVQGFDRSSITVRLGEYSFEQRDETQSKDFGVNAIIQHERYDTTTYVNDIALLTLDRQVDGTNIWPICLPPPNKSFAGVKATVIGWGTIYFGGPVSTTLQEVTIPVWENSECDAAYKDNGVFAENLCAGDKDGGKDSCQGDSGGPLMYQENGQWMVIGVVSWGIRCAEPNRPGVYARVSEFLSWVDQNNRG